MDSTATRIPTTAPLRRRAYRGGNPNPAPPKKCAWVALLMIGKAYAPGALVVAQSLRNMRTKHDLVCMVTDDVPAETVAQLELVYDRIVKVPYIEHPSRRFESSRQVEYYGGWIDKSFTKWNCLMLTEYDMVIFVDADMVAVANIDDLFDLAPPTATYANAWAYPWQRPGGLANPYLTCVPGKEDTCDLPHGARIPPEKVMEALHIGSFVGGATIVGLAPSREHYEALLKLIKEKEVFGLEYKSTSGADEVSIAVFYAQRGVAWTHMHQRYQAIPWKKNWVDRDIRAFHYIGRKPWDQDPDEWSDLADWWSVAKRLVKKYTQLHEVFFPTFTEVTPLDADATQLRITNDIRSLIMTAARSHKINGGRHGRGRGRGAGRSYQDFWRETDNILERWLMALVNTPGPAESYVSWAKVYRRSTLEDEFNNKLAGELVEKKLVATPTDAGTLVINILTLVDRRLSRIPRPSGAKASCTEENASYGSHFIAPLNPRLARLIELGGCEPAVAVALRYAVVVSTGQQWGLPQAHVDYLYDEFRVRGEAFASPLNARLLGKPDGKFCSIFPDTDAPFGSIGDFFAVPPEEFHSKNWVVNPPFVEELMTRAARRVTDLVGPEHEQTVFFVIPAWTDSEAYTLLHECPYTVAEVRLNPGEYVYEDAAGERRPTKAASIYFALSTEPLEVLKRLEDALHAKML